MKGRDHYVFIKENGKAQVIYDEGRWVTEHIRTAVLKFNYEIDKIDKLLVKDFTDEELTNTKKLLDWICWFSFFFSHLLNNSFGFQFYKSVQ